MFFNLFKRKPILTKPILPHEAHVFSNELRLTIGNSQLFRSPITSNEETQYLYDVESFGWDVAKNNLLLNITTRLLNVKHFRIVYHKDAKPTKKQTKAKRGPGRPKKKV